MRTQLILTKCCKCCRVKVNSNWLPEPRFLAKETNYTHTYCPDCLAAEMAKVENHSPTAAIISSGSMASSQPVPA